jgi:uncharacterized membrane protein YeaQ/YmgE (transglycosylase-associated protein family)
LALQQWASLPARPRSSLVGLAASVAGENGHDCRWEKVVVQSAMHARQLPECDDGTLKSEPSTKEGEHAATAEVIGVKQPMAGPDRCLNAHGTGVSNRWRHGETSASAPACEGAGSVGLIAQNEEKERTHAMLINLLVWIIVGGIAGWLASLLVQGTGLGIVGDVIVGIVGAFIGGFVLSLLLPGTFGLTGFNLGSLIVAFIGAVILLFVVKLFRGRRAVS